MTILFIYVCCDACLYYLVGVYTIQVLWYLGTIYATDPTIFGCGSRGHSATIFQDWPNPIGSRWCSPGKRRCMFFCFVLCGTVIKKTYTRFAESWHFHFSGTLWPYCHREANFCGHTYFSAACECGSWWTITHGGWCRSIKWHADHKAVRIRARKSLHKLSPPDPPKQENQLQNMKVKKDVQKCQGKGEKWKGKHDDLASKCRKQLRPLVGGFNPFALPKTSQSDAFLKVMQHATWVNASTFTIMW